MKKAINFLKAFGAMIIFLFTSPPKDDYFEMLHGNRTNQLNRKK